MRANDIESYSYLRYVFTELPAAKSVDDIEALLPHRRDARELIDAVSG